jgi:hypothetical protein
VANGRAEQFVNKPNSGFAPIGTGATSSQVWTESQWLKKTTADFAQFDVIIFGDQPPATMDRARWNTAIANRDVWSAAVTGNVLVFGGDPDYHSPADPNDVSQGRLLVEKAVTFAADQAGETGLYVAFSQVALGLEQPGGGYHPSQWLPEKVELLGGLGDFWAAGLGGNSPVKVASHLILDCVTEDDLRDWQCSAHQNFFSWPATYVPVLVVRDGGPLQGTPGYSPPCTTYKSLGKEPEVYCLARGPLNQLTADPCLQAHTPGQTPAQTCTVTATLRTLPAPGTPIMGRKIGFTITGPNQNATLSFSPTAGLTDANGQVSATYTGTATGQDIISVFLDDDADGFRDACEGSRQRFVTGMTPSSP